MKTIEATQKDICAYCTSTIFEGDMVFRVKYGQYACSRSCAKLMDMRPVVEKGP